MYKNWRCTGMLKVTFITAILCIEIQSINEMVSLFRMAWLCDGIHKKLFPVQEQTQHTACYYYTAM